MKKIFIDGKAGTTGLRIYDRLSAREDVTLITLPEEQRKDVTCRKAALNEADIAFLCLPDAAAIEAVSLVDNPDTVIIDTSTAHRTDPDWVYGMPELSVAQEQKVIAAKRIAVPGCHASGFVALVYPLVEAGILDKSVLLTCHSLTGYSGGGKKMIAEYEDGGRDDLLDAPRQYGIGQMHKHLKEMKAISGIENAPVFSPIVSDFYSGMEMTVPIFAKQLKDGKKIEDIKEIYKKYYDSAIVHYGESIDENGFVSANALSGKDCMEITVCGNDERAVLIARYDNLGKGASGAAVECLNLVIGADKESGLSL